MSSDGDKKNTARWLFAQECKILVSAVTKSSMPTTSLPEVAFAGRSNVGKSSLLNAITNRSTLAKVSHTPGRTKQLNFFSLADKLMIVDLPGYGYAKAPKTEIAGWTKLTLSYLRSRAQLKRVCILIDSRHGLKDSDFQIMKMLDEAGVVYQIILTKIDKTSQQDLITLKAKITDLMQQHPALHPEILTTSSRKKNGIDDVREMLFQLTQS